MQLIQCNPGHSAAILAIFNDAIVHSTALYDYKPRTMEMMKAWFDIKAKGNYPVIGIVNDAGELMAFASYGAFRALPAYKYTVEHSLYVDARFRGQGLGTFLLREIVATAQRQGYHLMVGVIDSENIPSKRLHEKFGFQHSGTLQQAGFKFGRWLTIDFYQLILPTPDNPRDDA